MRRYGLIFPDTVDQNNLSKEYCDKQPDIDFDKFYKTFENTFEQVMVFHDNVLFNISDVIDDISSPLFCYICERKKTRAMEKQIQYKEKMLNKVVSEAEKQKAIELAEYIKRSNLYLEKQKEILSIRYEECRKEIQITLEKFKYEKLEYDKQNSVVREALEDYKKTICYLQEEMKKINSKEDEKYYYKREYNILCDRIKETYDEMIELFKIII